MSILGTSGALTGAYPYELLKKVEEIQETTVNFAEYLQKNTVNSVNFGEQLQKSGETTDISDTNMYQKYLEQRYGYVCIQSVGKDQKSMDRIGAETAGTGNVVIAPNILEQMANDPKKAAYYEGKIQDYFQSLPLCKAQLSAMGHEIHSSGIVIHPDGTVTHYVSGDLKPEERARIEAQIQAETEEKVRRRREYQRRSEEAAREWRLEIESAYKKQRMWFDGGADVTGFPVIV